MAMHQSVGMPQLVDPFLDEALLQPHRVSGQAVDIGI